MEVATVYQKEVSWLLSFSAEETFLGHTTKFMEEARVA